MNNVVDISSARRKRYIKANVEEVRADVISALTSAELSEGGDDAIHSVMLKDLDALADDMLIRKLQLIHAKEAAARNWNVQESEMVAEMEAAAYLAYRAGVPEESIYDLNYEGLSDALSSAILKVNQS